MVTGGLMISSGFTCGLIYLPLQVIVTILVRGPLRWITLLPVPFALFVGTSTIIAYVQQGAQWPLCMIFTSPIAVLYLVIVLIVYLALPRDLTRPLPKRPDLGLRCQQCSYDLRGLPRPGVCPECGTPIP